MKSAKYIKEECIGETFDENTLIEYKQRKQQERQEDCVAISLIAFACMAYIW